MNRFSILVGGVGVAVSPLALALGLGDIHVDSYLGQPFSARVPIHSHSGDDLNEWQAKLAKRQKYDRSGLELTAAASKMKFSIEKRKNGKSFIRIKSREPIADPFVVLLVEIDTPSGQMLREYTVLLDPPGEQSFTPANKPVIAHQIDTATGESIFLKHAVLTSGPSSQSAQAKPSNAPTPALTQASQDANDTKQASPPHVNSTVQAERPAAKVNKPAKVAKSPHRAHTHNTAQSAHAKSKPNTHKPRALDHAKFDFAKMTYGPTSRHDDLWQIAKALVPAQHSVSPQQVEMALVRKNPKAFVNENVNGLRTGIYLLLPSVEEMRLLSKHDAIKLAQHHNQQWKARNHKGHAEYKAKQHKTAHKAHTQKSSPRKPVKRAKTTQLPPPAPRLVASFYPDQHHHVDHYKKHQRHHAESKSHSKANKPQSHAPKVKLQSSKSGEVDNLFSSMQGEISASVKALNVAKHDNEALHSINDKLKQDKTRLELLLAQKSKEIERLEQQIVQTQMTNQSASQNDVAPSTNTVASTKGLQASYTQSYANIPQAGEVSIEPFNFNTLLLYGGACLLMLLGGGLVGRNYYRRKLEAHGTTETESLATPSAAQPKANKTQKNKPKPEIVQHHAQELDILEKVDVYMTHERFEKAEKELKYAVKLHPLSIDLYKKLLEVYAGMKDEDQFEQTFLYLTNSLQYSDEVWLDEIKQLKTSTWAAVDHEQSQASSHTDEPEPLTPLTASPENHSIEQENQPSELNTDEIHQDELASKPFEITPDNLTIDSEPETTPVQDDSKDAPLSFSVDLDETTQEEGSAKRSQDTDEDALQTQALKFDLTGMESTEDTDESDSSDTAPEQTPSDDNPQDDDVNPATMLELAQGYIDMNEIEEAVRLLNIVINTGDETSKAQAQKLLSRYQD